MQRPLLDHAAFGVHNGVLEYEGFLIQFIYFVQKLGHFKSGNHAEKYLACLLYTSQTQPDCWRYCS